jgi:hypothetical protein
LLFDPLRRNAAPKRSEFVARFSGDALRESAQHPAPTPSGKLFVESPSQLGDSHGRAMPLECERSPREGYF